MRLREVVELLRKMYGDKNQTQIGARLGVAQTKVSTMIKVGSEWEEHWQVFLNIAAAAKKFGFDPAQDLESVMVTEVMDHGFIQDGEGPYRRSAPHVPQAPRQDEKSGRGNLPKGRVQRRRK